jgi:VanZ family protein
VYGLLAVAFAAFATWGSFFPFNFRAVTAATALRQFLLPWRHGATTWSMSDLASNVMLFMPIGFFTTAAIESWFARSTPRWSAAVATMAMAIPFSIALELTQAFLPYRTPSVVDVMAEALGVVAGMVIWLEWYNAFNTALADMLSALERASTARRLLLLYCAAFAIVWLFPLDFTIRPHEIADKYLHQRLLLPFQPSPDATTRMGLLMALLAGIPLGGAAVLGGGAPGDRRPLAKSLVIASSMLLLLETAQVTVFSRTTDATAILALAIGTAVGAVAGYLAPPRWQVA